MNFGKRSAVSPELKPIAHSAGQRMLALVEEHGSSMIEFALVLPPLLMIVTGIFSYGIAYNNQLALTQAVGSGGQYLQLIRTSTSDPCADTFTAIQNAAPNLTPSNLTISVSMNGTTPAQSGNSCAGAQSNLVAGSPVTVKAQYTCRLAVYGMPLVPGCTLSAQVTEYEY